MIERLKIILTHPTRIGLFFKDKIYIPILFLLTMFFLFVGVNAVYNFNTTQYSHETSKNYTLLVQYSLNDSKEKPTFNITFDSTTNKLKGDTHVFKSDNIILAINSVNVYQKNGVLTVNLLEDGAVLYEGFIKLGYVEYKSISAKSFDLTKVQNGVIEDSLYFSEFLDSLFLKVKNNQALLHLADDTMTTVIFYFGLLIFTLIASYMINPPIEMRVRAKLVLYDSFSYLFIMLLAALFRASWLQYVALVFPLLYVNLTFSHIKKIR